MADKKVGIVADSTACLPSELAKELDIHVVSVDLVFESKVYRDGLDSNHEEFYTLLKSARRLPTTSAPSPSSYLEAMREAGKGREGVLCVTVSSRVSAMHESARLAGEMAQRALPGLQVAVLDSGTAAMAQGFVALEAARKAAQGMNLAEVEAAARQVAAKANIVAMLDTLYYLAKGGRIPKATAWIGSVLSIKPILEFHQGEVRLIERARTRPRALARLLDIVEGRVGARPVHVAVAHAHAAEEAQILKEKIRARWQCLELYVTPFTPIMGAHLGPGLVGVAFYLD